jgi:hypothetical protein
MGGSDCVHHPGTPFRMLQACAPPPTMRQSAPRPCRPLVNVSNPRNGPFPFFRCIEGINGKSHAPDLLRAMPTLDKHRYAAFAGNHRKYK